MVISTREVGAELNSQKKSREPLDYLLQVSLMGIEPPIWRKIRVPSSITFKKLHEVLQILMGWQQYHLYEFKYGPIRIGIPDDEYFILDDTHWDSSRTKLSSLRPDMNDVFTYTYDFGDYWLHLLHLEHIVYAKEGQDPIACLGGARACPPEDVGGKVGYEEFLEVIADPDDEQHADFVEWSGGHYDPERFDIEAVQQQLRRLTRQRPKV